MKFVNRTSRAAFLECINYEGNRELRQTIEAGKEWTVSTFEQTYWVATANRETDEGLLVNYGWFYSPKKSKSKRERVIITDCKYDLVFIGFQVFNTFASNERITLTSLSGDTKGRIHWQRHS